MRTALSFIAAAAFALSLAGSADAAKSCRDDKGHFAKCAAAAAGNGGSSKSPAASYATPATAAAAPTAAAAMRTPSGGPQCKKGKRCGNSCISVRDVCHK